MQNTNDIRIEILSLIPEPTGINVNDDRCKDFDDRPNTSYSCFVSKQDSTKIFQSILNILEKNGYHYKSTTRQDYGSWSVILSKNNKNIVLKCQDISSAKYGHLQKLKQDGYLSKLNITVREDE